MENVEFSELFEKNKKLIVSFPSIKKRRNVNKIIKRY